MAAPVNPAPVLPRAPTTAGGLVAFLQNFLRMLTAELRAHAHRLNGLRANDGQEGPLRSQSYTVAGVPPASLWTGATIYVSNESGGAVLAFSDGSQWRRWTDRAVIS